MSNRIIDPKTNQEIVQLEFWIDGHIYAMRHTNLIPAIGDEVRFKDVAYKVFYKIWIYDDDVMRVALNMEQVKKDDDT